MDKRKILGIIIGIIAFIALIAGATFAYFSWQSSNEQRTEITFTSTGLLSCGVDGGGNIANQTTFAPASCIDSTYVIQRTLTTSITSSGNAPVSMDMWLNVDSIDDGLSGTQYFKYALTTTPLSSDSQCSESSLESSNTVVTHGNFYGIDDEDTIPLLSGVNQGGTYYLYIWLDSEETSLSTMSQSVSLSLGGECAEVEQITCAPGTYLAANASSCTQCPAGSYCPGYTGYPDSSNHGITACQTGSISSAGASECTPCQNGTTTSGVGQTSCSACPNNANVSTWSGNGCTINTCASGYTNTNNACVANSCTVYCTSTSNCSKTRPSSGLYGVFTCTNGSTGSISQCWYGTTRCDGGGEEVEETYICETDDSYPEPGLMGVCKGSLGITPGIDGLGLSGSGYSCSC